MQRVRYLFGKIDLKNKFRASNFLKFIFYIIIGTIETMRALRD